FVQLSEGMDSAPVAWTGDLTLNGQALRLDSLRFRDVQALSLSSDGSLSVSRVTSKTKDASGRTASQVLKTMTTVRAAGRVTTKMGVQETSGYVYDQAGQAVEYARRTKEWSPTEGSPAAEAEALWTEEKVTGIIYDP